ncbi:hypothetical protein LZL87_013972 [Fusarium oxysporum]|nr:hypothetical protein LZL87_013972 [Fusarium oxysporum]
MQEFPDSNRNLGPDPRVRPLLTRLITLKISSQHRRFYRHDVDVSKRRKAAVVSSAYAETLHHIIDIKSMPINSTYTAVGRIDDELKRFAEVVELGAAGLPTADSTLSELDELASALVNLLTSAEKAAGRPTRNGARIAPWWTEECAGAAAAFHAIRRLYPLGFNEEV